MSRRLRFIPAGGATVEITCRTLQGRHLLRPGKKLRAITHGILARALERYPVEIHAFAFLSNHYHLLLTVPDAQSMAHFMNYVNSNLAREAGRLIDWREKFWGRRYQAIVVSTEPRALIGRLKYVLSQGVKEGLVRRPQDWPGAHSVRALLKGSEIHGTWWDRTRAFAARRSDEAYRPEDFAEATRFRLTPLPCWSDRPEAWCRQRIAELCRLIETEHRTAIKDRPPPSQPLAPDERPLRLKTSPAPWFHCASRRARRKLYEAYSWFLASYRDAAERLRAGDLASCFPPGCFPPPRPFVVP